MNQHYQRLIKLLKPNTKEIGKVYTFAIFKGLIALSLPLGIQSIINLIQGGSVSSSWIVLSVIIAVGIGCNGYLQLMQMRIMENIQQQLFTKAAFDFTFQLPKIKLDAIRQYYAPELMNRFFEVLTIQKSLSKVIIDLSSAVMQILLGLILLSLYHPFFIMFSLSLVIIMLLIIRFTTNNAMQSSLAESKYKYKVVSWLEELARARHSFKLAGNTNMPIQKSDEYVAGYLKSREQHFSILRIQFKWLILFKILVALFLLMAGGFLVINQQMNIGQFVAAEIIIMMVMEAAEKIMISLESVYDLFTAAQKLEQITELPIDTESGKIDQLTQNQLGPLSVEIVGLDFAFASHHQLLFDDLNFKFEKGKKYYISGKSGSGKSTLLHIITGLYQPSKGNICINDIPLANYGFGELYRMIGNGLKEESMFEGTILENITLGREKVSIEDVQAVLEKVMLNTHVKTLPMGLMTTVHPQGNNLPSSIIQKILLARTLVTHPRLILLEQSLDAIEETERKAIAEMLCASPEWTLMVTGHQDFLQKKCDVCLELKEGKIIVNNKI